MKLREVYQKLRGEHIVLLRSNGEVQKKLLTVEKDRVDAEGEARVSDVLDCGGICCHGNILCCRRNWNRR